MLGYATLGTSDMERACAFYDALLDVIGGKRVFNDDRMQFYGTGEGAMLAVCTPYDEQPHVAGNGQMVAINAGDAATVDEVYAKAIELGASDEGEPGQRLPFFYGGYVRDLDGNKLCFFEMKMG